MNIYGKSMSIRTLYSIPKEHFSCQYESKVKIKKLKYVKLYKKNHKHTECVPQTINMMIEARKKKNCQGTSELNN